ncbi:MAG: hypothetical protein IPK03_15920 [Bacteroidetes bacterium]|nr:hypothetical protein [Bacteroidota bacterium]
MKFLLTIFLSILALSAHSSDSTRAKFSNKGLFYAYWGYNRSFFTSSDIRFTSANYDITFKDVKASDRPSPFSLENYIGSFTVPQYVFRFGYFPFDRIHFSIGMDHLKYVVDQGQTVKYSGYIDPKFSPKFGGNHNEDSFLVGGDDLSFEHTNGLNMFSLDAGYLLPIYPLYRDKIWFNWNSGVCLNLIVTKTDVRILNEGIDNRFHLSGYAFSLVTGPRIEFWKWIALGFEWKAGYVNLPSVLIENDADKHASHHFFFAQYHGYLALQLPLAQWITKGKKK